VKKGGYFLYSPGEADDKQSQGWVANRRGGGKVSALMRDEGTRGFAVEEHLPRLRTGKEKIIT